MATEDNDFLREQVQRLNSVLAQYQEKYPPIGIRGEAGLSVEGPTAPWLTDQSLVSPLLKEYDTRTQVLEEQLDSYRRDHKELRSQIDKLVAENKRLTRELKLSIESQLDKIDSSMTTPVDVEEDHVLHNLQSQLQMALQEKESAMEMWQASVQEVERLEQDLQNQSINPRVQHLQQTTERIKEQYTKTVHELNNEISLLQEELRRCKSELKASSIQVTDLRKTLENVKSQLVRAEHEKINAEGQGSVAGGRLQELQKSIDELQTKLEDSNKELGHLRKEKQTMEVRILELQKKIATSEANEYDRTIQVKESNQVIESALLEKDQALVRERQAMEQVEKMQEALAKLVDEAGARTREEVDNVKKQCNQNISRLMEEIHTFEMENCEKQAQIDRAIREKRAAESELEKLYREGLVQTNKEGSTREELSRRACDAERLRDEALMKLDAAHNELRRADIAHKQEKSNLSTELNHLKERLKDVNREFEDANNDRVKLTEEIDKLKRNMQKVRSEKDSSQRNYTKEMTILERDLRMKEQNFEVKLQSVEDAHRHAMMELRQMLAAQQRMSAKWKEECNTITQKFETKVNDLRTEISRQKRRIEELTKLLRESKDKNIEAENMIAEYGRNIKRMEDRVRDAENRAANASLQVAKQLGKARQMLHTSTHTAYDTNMRQSFHDSVRSKTSGGVADPLNVSDLMGNGSVHKSSIRIIDQQETVDSR